MDTDAEDMDILAKIESLAALGPGDPLPEWMKQEPGYADNNWLPVVSNVLREAATEIRRLRNTYEPDDEGPEDEEE